MSLYIVTRQNNSFRMGTYFSKFDDGFQEAVMERRGNRMHIVGNKGFLFPYSVVQPLVRQLLKKGFDYQK